MEKEIKVGIHNCFDFVRRDAKTGEVLGEYKAENIILNGFWNKFLSATSWDCLRYIHFGSGTATPIASDVKLTTWVGYKTAPVYNAADTSYDISQFHTHGIASVKKSVRLQDTEYNGSFISEVGYSSSTSSTTGLLTKALVKDMNGNVVSIEKKAGEVLDIFATFYVNFGTGFDGGNVYIAQTGASVGEMLWRMMFYMSSNGIVGNMDIGYLQGRPQPQCGAHNSGMPGRYSLGNATSTFDVSNKKMVLSAPNLIASNGNIEGGIRGMGFGSILINLPCTGFSQPVLTKEVVGTGDGSNKDFQTKFGYIKNNGTAKVYVNDVEVSTTIDYNQMYPKTNIVNDLVIVDYTKMDNTTQSSNVIVLGTAQSPTNGTWVIAENPLYATAGVVSIKGSYFTAYGSNDMTTWTKIAERTGSSITINIASENQNFRYLKFESNGTTGYGVTEVNSTAAESLKNIHLASAPAVGDTVAVTYQPDCIAKDDQHVLNNVKVTLTFNEYTPT